LPGLRLEDSDCQAVLRLQKAETAAPGAEREASELFSGDVREHVDSIEELVASHPELGYKAIGRKLAEKLRVKLSGAHLQVLRRIMTELSEGRAAVDVPEWEDCNGDMRDHVDAIRALVVVHPGMGYKGIAHELQRHLRVKLSQAHLSVIRRIVAGISEGRAVAGAQREGEDYGAFAVDVRDHVVTIKELMMRHPTMDYEGIAHELEEKLQVELSDAQKRGILRVMAEIGIELVAEDVAMPEQTDLELLASHPELGYRVIARKLAEKLGVKLSPAHQLVIKRIKTELSEGRAAVDVPEWEEFNGGMRDHVDAIRALVVVHPGTGYKGIAHELQRHLRVKLSQAHLSVINRIVAGISEGRAVAGAQREGEDYGAFAVHVRDHVATIKELMMRHPTMDYEGIAHELEEKLQVERSDAQKRGILRVMAEIGIELVAEDGAMPEQTDLEDFTGDVREHVDSIKELVALHPGLGYRFIGRKLEEKLQVSLSQAHLQVILRIMTEISEGRLAVGVSMRQQPERRHFCDFTGDLRQHVDIIKELMTLHPTKGRHHIAGELEIRLQKKLTDAHLSIIRRIMIRHGVLSYEFLSGADQVAVVQGLVQGHAEPAARRQAVQEHYERGVSLAVLGRWMSEHYAPDRGGCPVRRVWQDKYVDCARTYRARRAGAKTDEDAALQAIIKSVHGEAVPVWMLQEALHRAATIRYWEAERRLEFTAVCHGTLPRRTALPSGARGAVELQHYRFFIRYESWVACELCGYRWQVLKGQQSGSTYVYGNTVRGDCVHHLPRCRSCDHRGKLSQCSLPLEALLWPLPSEIEAGVKTEQLYVVPQRKHWPVYLPAAQRFVTAYDFSTRLELAVLVREFADYEQYVREHGAEGIVSLLDITKEEAASITPYLLVVTKQKERGSVARGPTYNWKKTQVCRVNYKREDLETCGAMTPRARAAYDWLMVHNRTYRRYAMQQKRMLSYPEDEREMFIATYRLLLQSQGIEVALFPVLYPWEVYSDSDVRGWAGDRKLMKRSQLPSMQKAFLRKVHSRCRTYGDAEAVPDLAFLLYDMATAQKISASLAVAEHRGITPDVVADNSSTSESYWRHEQDLLCDVVQQHTLRYSRGFAFPNLFITIAPAEWKVLLHQPLFADWKAANRLSACQGMLSEHIYELLCDAMKQILRPSEFFSEVRDYVIRLEFQGRKTQHIHIAAWLIHRQVLSGRSGTGDISPFVRFLEEVFRGSVDVQHGEGFLNYINGNVVKGNQSMDFQPDAARSGGDDHSAWRTTYRMCKLAPGLPEVFLDFAGAAHIYRTFAVVNACAIIPGRRDPGDNDTKRLHEHYVARLVVSGELDFRGSFLSYIRTYAWKDAKTVTKRRGRGQDCLVAVGVRYAFEMQDNFIGQFCTMMFPHRDSATFLPPSETEVIAFTAYCLRALQYLRHLAWTTGTPPGRVDSHRRRLAQQLHRAVGENDVAYAARLQEVMDSSRWVGFASNAKDIPSLSALPAESITNDHASYTWELFHYWPSHVIEGDENARFQRHPLRFPDATVGACGKPFEDADSALNYLANVVQVDLAIRVPPGRARSFRARLFAVHCFYNYMEYCRENPFAIPHALRQQWEESNVGVFHFYDKFREEWNRVFGHWRPVLTWSADQQEVLRVVGGLLSRADANVVHEQFYYVQGEPGSGKTEVLCEAARRAADAGLRVLVLGPTGTLVHTYKTKVQHENINVETIHSAWHIYRSADTVVDYAPPTRLRSYDLFIIDEASQIEDAVAVPA
ncbi:unnamed protein product, partial [Prorocentrum cordatum]